MGIGGAGAADREPEPVRSAAEGSAPVREDPVCKNKRRRQRIHANFKGKREERRKGEKTGHKQQACAAAAQPAQLPSAEQKNKQKGDGRRDPGRDQAVSENQQKQLQVIIIKRGVHVNVG